MFPGKACKRGRKQAINSRWTDEMVGIEKSREPKHRMSQYRLTNAGIRGTVEKVRARSYCARVRVWKRSFDSQDLRGGLEDASELEGVRQRGGRLQKELGERRW